MADKEVAIKISVETEGGARSLSELKKEFKDTQKELEGLDTSSKKYVQTLEKLGGIKDEIGDLNAEINAFNPEGKIQAFGNVVGGLASGFQAAQGAAALFGAEGEELQKTLVKVQAASAFADGIKGVMGMSDSFKVLGNVIKANPLMLLATVLLGLGAAMVSLKDKIGFIGDAFDAITGTINKGIDALKSFTDWMGITSFKAEELAAKQIKLAEAVGKATDERYTKEINRAKAAGEETIDIEIKKQAALVASLKLQHKDFAQAQEDLLLLVIQRNKKIKDEDEKAYLERKARRDKETADAKALNKEVEELRKIDLLDTSEKEKQKEQEQNDALNRKFLKNLEINEKLKAEEQKRAEHDLALEKEKEAAKLEVTLAGLESAAILTDIAFTAQLNRAKGNEKEELKIKEKQFKVNKAFQVVNATMNGIQAIQAIMATAVDPTGITTAIRIGASAALTAANIAKILSTKFDAGGTGGGGSSADLGAGAGGVAVAPPTQGSTNLNADGTIRQSAKQVQPVVKAVVTETDITKTQKKINTIEEQSKL